MHAREHSENTFQGMEAELDRGHHGLTGWNMSPKEMTQNDSSQLAKISLDRILTGWTLTESRGKLAHSRAIVGGSRHSPGPVQRAEI